MEIWRAEPGDVVRLPESCWPRVVTVTDNEYAPEQCNRVHWQATRAYGSTVLPDMLEVDLLATRQECKRPFLAADAPQPEPEAGR